MAKRKSGRKRGGHNRGYFYRKGRGWYVVENKRLIPLQDEQGLHIKEEKGNKELLKDAYARWRTQPEDEIEEQKRQAKRATIQHTVHDLCKVYLYHVHVNGAQKTLADRMDTLFDLCWGLPPEYREPKTFVQRSSPRLGGGKRKGNVSMTATAISLPCPSPSPTSTSGLLLTTTGREAVSARGFKQLSEH